LDAALQSCAAGIAVQPERHSTPASPPQLRIPAAIEAYTTCTRLVGTRAHSSTLLMPATSAQDTSACSSHALGLSSAPPLASCPAAHLHHLLTKPVSSARGRPSAAASPSGGSPEEHFQVIVKVSSKSITVNGLSTSTTVGDLKAMLSDKSRIPPREMRLGCKGKQMEDFRALGTYGIGSASNLDCNLRVRGGRPDPLPKRPAHPSEFSADVRRSVKCFEKDSYTWSELVDDVDADGNGFIWKLDKNSDFDVTIRDEKRGREMYFIHVPDSNIETREQLVACQESLQVVGFCVDRKTYHAYEAFVTNKELAELVRKGCRLGAPHRFLRRHGVEVQAQRLRSSDTQDAPRASVRRFWYGDGVPVSEQVCVAAVHLDKPDPQPMMRLLHNAQGSSTGQLIHHEDEVLGLPALFFEIEGPVLFAMDSPTGEESWHGFNSAVGRVTTIIDVLLSDFRNALPNMLRKISSGTAAVAVDDSAVASPTTDASSVAPPQLEILSLALAQNAFTTHGLAQRRQLVEYTRLSDAHLLARTEHGHHSDQARQAMSAVDSLVASFCDGTWAYEFDPVDIEKAVDASKAVQERFINSFYVLSQGDVRACIGEGKLTFYEIAEQLGKRYSGSGQGRTFASEADAEACKFALDAAIAGRGVRDASFQEVGVFLEALRLGSKQRLRWCVLVRDSDGEPVTGKCKRLVKSFFCTHPSSLSGKTYSLAIQNRFSAIRRLREALKAGVGSQEYMTAGGRMTLREYQVAKSYLDGRWRSALAGGRKLLPCVAAALDTARSHPVNTEDVDRLEAQLVTAGYSHRGRCNAHFHDSPEQQARLARGCAMCPSLAMELDDALLEYPVDSAKVERIQLTLICSGCRPTHKDMAVFKAKVMHNGVLTVYWLYATLHAPTMDSQVMLVRDSHYGDNKRFLALLGLGDRTSISQAARGCEFGVWDCKTMMDKKRNTYRFEYTITRMICDASDPSTWFPSAATRWRHPTAVATATAIATATATSIVQPVAVAPPVQLGDAQLFDAETMQRAMRNWASHADRDAMTCCVKEQ
jgi:hypothetical protein